jgi:Domain of unknown function (DUF4340)
VGRRQVIVLYLVLAALAAEYLLIERRRPPPPHGLPARERFLPLRAEELRQMRLEQGGRTVTSRRAGERWVVVDPPSAAIPPDLIAAFARALAGAEQIERVKENNADLRTYGLDERAARVEVRGASGDPFVVTLGGTNPTGTAIYAQLAGTPEVVLIGRDVRYYEELIFQALTAGAAPAVDGRAPIGG